MPCWSILKRYQKRTLAIVAGIKNDTIIYYLSSGAGGDPVRAATIQVSNSLFFYSKKKK